ncbi:hypothetical protein M514_01727, partial [Trichuris suis]
LKFRLQLLYCLEEIHGRILSKRSSIYTNFRTSDCSPRFSRDAHSEQTLHLLGFWVRLDVFDFPQASEQLFSTLAEERAYIEDLKTTEENW